MGNRCNVGNRFYLKSHTADGADRVFTSHSRPLNVHVDFAQAVTRGFLNGGFRNRLSGKRSRFFRSAEAEPAGRRPCNRIALQVGNRNDRIIECSLNVYVAFVYALFFFSLFNRSHCISQKRRIGRRRIFCRKTHPHFLCRTKRPSADKGSAYAFFLLATVFFLPLRVRAFVRVRCPRTGSPRL